MKGSVKGRGQNAALAGVVFALLTAGDVAVGTTWKGTDGDWFTATNWDAGVPNAAINAVVPKGYARFSTPAEARGLEIGVGGVRNIVTGTVVGGATLEASSAVIGLSGRGGSSGTGRLMLQNGSFIVRDAGLLAGVGNGSETGVHNVGTGSVDVQGGDVTLQAQLYLGAAGGSGVDGRFDGNGTITIKDGTLTVGYSASVGTSFGSGTASGTGTGRVSITRGDFIVQRGSSIDSGLSIGTAGGSGGWRGNANGVVEITDGSVSAETIVVGSSSANSPATAAAQGRLLVTNGDVLTSSLSIGVDYGISPTRSTGLFQQLVGSTITRDLQLGPGGTIVLGIGGAGPRESSLIRASSAVLNGAVEVRFLNGFKPRPGDEFTMMVVGNISGSYSLRITGINTQQYPDLRITQDNHYLRLSFPPVPEPASFALAACVGAAFLTVRMRGRSRCR